MDRDVFQLNSEIEMKHWWFVARRQIISGIIRELLPANASNTVVDVGCGTGGNISDLAADYRCFGIDPSADAIAWARERFPDVHFTEGLAPQDLGNEARQADLFMLNDVLEHVPDDFQVFSELLSVSKPGALFVMTVPADMSLWSPHDEIHGHYRRYTSERFAQIWEGMPVESMLLSHFNARLYPIVKTLRTVNRIRRTSSGDHGTDLKVPATWLNQRLTNIFAGEQSRLMKQLQRKQTSGGFGRGVSLVTVLRRQAGEVSPRQRPPHLADDPTLFKAA